MSWQLTCFVIQWNPWHGHDSPCHDKQTPCHDKLSWFCHWLLSPGEDHERAAPYSRGVVVLKSWWSFCTEMKALKDKSLSKQIEPPSRWSTRSRRRSCHMYPPSETRTSQRGVLVPKFKGHAMFCVLILCSCHWVRLFGSRGKFFGSPRARVNEGEVHDNIFKSANLALYQDITFLARVWLPPEEESVTL